MRAQKGWPRNLKIIHSPEIQGFFIKTCNMKEKVMQWIQLGCNFNLGLYLLAEIGKNKQLPRIMAGNEKRYAGKLFYELCKAAGYTMQEYQELKDELQNIVEQLALESGDENPPEGGVTTAETSAGDPPAGDASTGETSGEKLPSEDLPSTDPPAVDPPINEVPKVGAPATDQLPESVEKVIREHANLFKLRAQLHEQMAGLPESNDDETVKKRRNLSDSIALISSRIDLMFAAKEAFYNEGILPDITVLFPEPAQDPPAGPEDNLPADAAGLKKMKKNLQTANTKDQNQLEYQEAKKGAKPNPMPAGPKRIRIEKRISERNEQIGKIDFKLLSIDSKD